MAWKWRSAQSGKTEAAGPSPSPPPLHHSEGAGPSHATGHALHLPSTRLLQGSTGLTGLLRLPEHAARRPSRPECSLPGGVSSAMLLPRTLTENPVSGAHPPETGPHPKKTRRTLLGQPLGCVLNKAPRWLLHTHLGGRGPPGVALWSSPEVMRVSALLTLAPALCFSNTAPPPTPGSDRKALTPGPTATDSEVTDSQGGLRESRRSAALPGSWAEAPGSV